MQVWPLAQVQHGAALPEPGLEACMNLATWRCTNRVRTGEGCERNRGAACALRAVAARLEVQGRLGASQALVRC